MVPLKGPSKAKSSIVQYCISGRAGQEYSSFHFARFQIFCQKTDYFHSLPRSRDLKIAWKNAKRYSRCYATDCELILAQFEPMYEIEANPTKIHFSPLFQFWVKIQREPLVCRAKALKELIQPIPSPFICVDFISEVSLFISPLPTEQKTASGRQKWKPVFESYLKIAGSHGVFDSRFGIYVIRYVYMDVFVIIIDLYGELETNHVFGRNPFFAVCEQHATVRKKLRPQSGWKYSKVPPNFSESCFLSYVRHSLHVTRSCASRLYPAINSFFEVPVHCFVPCRK